MIEKMRENETLKRKTPKNGWNREKIGRRRREKRLERYYPKYFPISARRNDWREC
jgi:hypothetical protein